MNVPLLAISYSAFFGEDLFALPSVDKTLSRTLLVMPEDFIIGIAASTWTRNSESGNPCFE